MNISLKNYHKKYQKACSQLAEQNWAFQDLLYGPKDKNILFEGFFKSYLVQSHYRKVAINEKGEVLGYLLGKNRRKKSLKLWLEKMGVNSLYLYYILRGKLGEKKRIFKLLKLQNATYNKVIPPSCDFDSEIELLFVHKKARGLGIARLLLEDFFDNYCKTNGLNNVILFTDESSTYKFYDRYGFKKYKTTPYPQTLREVQGNRAFTYILHL